MSEKGNKEKPYKVKVSADVRDAERSIQGLQKQVDKLHSIADQGEFLQRGFLSPKQVFMYKKMISEMESTYTNFSKKVAKKEEERSSLVSSQDRRRTELEKEVYRRQDAYKKARTPNRWGDEASPVIQEYTRVKLEEAESAHMAYMGSDNSKAIKAKYESLTKEIDALTESLSRMQSEIDVGGQHSQRIENMHVKNRELERAMDNMISTMIGGLTIAGPGMYAAYTRSGMQGLRQQEMSSSALTQVYDIDKYKDADSRHRESVQDLGVLNQYDITDTLSVQRELSRGGARGDLQSLNADTHAIQMMSRAYALDATATSSDLSSLKKIGAVEDGEMRRLADYIAGAINRTQMSGRESELIRSTSALANSVSKGMDSLSNDQLLNLINLQSMMGEDMMSFRGDAGAERLANLDATIKNGGHGMDLIMGKGTKYTGLAGVYELEYMKEQGLSNPENLKNFFDGLDTRIGGTEEAKAFAAKEQLGLSLHEFKAIRELGLDERFKKGDYSVNSNEMDQLRAMGANDLVDQISKWNQTDSSVVSELDALASNRQTDHSKLANEGALLGRGMFSGLPEFMQHTLLPVSGLGAAFVGGKFVKKTGSKLLRNFSTKVSDNGDYSKVLSRLAKKDYSNALNPITSKWDTGLDEAGKLLGKVPGADKLLKGSTKAIPFLGTAVGVGLDQMMNEENSLGRSIFKGLGGTFGGILGGGVGAFAGPVGVGAGALSGGFAGEKLADSLYTALFGKESSKDQVFYSNDEKNRTITEMSTAPKELDVAKESTSDKFAKFSTDTQSNQEITVRVIMEGGVEGMSKDNEDKIAESVVKSFSMSSFGTASFGLNLAMDQTRR